MRVLLLFRGAPGVGKTTYIKEHHLENYTLSADDIRLKIQSPILMESGGLGISQENESVVWQILFTLLQQRMSRGEFTVIDATNSKTTEMNRYKEFAVKYKYRMYIIDMTDVPIAEVKLRNSLRLPEYKRVPDKAIDKMYARFKTQQVPSGITVLKPEEFSNILYRLSDFSDCKKIHHIGDIHSCMKPISEYLRTQYFGFNYDMPEYWRSERWLSMEDFDGEIWKDIEGYEGLYQISSYGRLKSLPKTKNSKPNIYILKEGYRGYLYVNLSSHSQRKTFKMHQLVWKTFGDQEAEEVNHIDGVTSNNNIKNLESTTRLDNERHCWENGLKKGRRVSQYTLDGDLIKIHDSIKQAAEETGTNNRSIANCCKAIYQTAGGFKWEYTDEIDNSRGGRAIKVSQYTLKGKFIKTYDSIKEAERAVGIKTIRNCLSGYLKTAGGYKWECTDIDYTNHKDNVKFNDILYSPEYLKSLLNPEHKYIFVGDYLDRGIETVEVLKFLLSIYKLPNVIMLEGNHELIPLRNYASNIDDYPRYFKEYTLPILNKAIKDKEFTKSDIRKFCRNLGQACYYQYHDKKVLVCHGGISGMKDNLIYVSTEQIIKGVGAYSDYLKCANMFENNTDENTYQISGHRNAENVDTHATKRCFNLEGKVECGGYLRTVSLDKKGFETYEVKNNVFKEPNNIKEEIIVEDNILTNEEIVSQFRNNKFIREKEIGNISAFNFTRSAFANKIWDKQTITARGLFVNNQTNDVVARGYDKFFNVNEREETKILNLQQTIKFPVTAYVKENGFLGIISLNPETKNLMFATKSMVDYDCNENDLVNVFKSLYYELTTKKQQENLLDYLKLNNKSIVCECVHQQKDPHIIEYANNGIYLLDVINNDFNSTKIPYENLLTIADNIGLICKEKAKSFTNWEDFYSWYLEVTEEDYKYNNRHIEGFVVEDAVGFMFKLKLAYYKFWKMMRGITHTVLKRGEMKNTASLFNAEANYYYAWIKKHRTEYIYKDENGKTRFNDVNIITMRNKFKDFIKDNEQLSNMTLI